MRVAFVIGAFVWVGCQGPHREPPRADVSPEPARAVEAQMAIVAEHTQLSLTRAASLADGTVLAIGPHGAYKLNGSHWVPMRIEDAEPRDVIASGNVFWILAKGTGHNAGHVLIIRSRRGDDLLAIASPAIGPSTEPMVLATGDPGEFYVGGTNPALARVVGETFTQLDIGVAMVRALRRTRDESTVAQAGNGQVVVVRWGTMQHIEAPGYLDTVLDPEETTYLVRTTGEITRGRPGREFARITDAAPIAPRYAAAIGHGVFALLDAEGAVAIWTSHAWHVTPAPTVHAPIAITGTDPPMVIGATGSVVAIDAHGARVVVAGI